MADGDLSVLAGNEERLRLENRNFTRRRIAHVADRTRAAQTIELRLRERFRDVSHLAFLAKFDTVGCDNATTPGRDAATHTNPGESGAASG